MAYSITTYSGAPVATVQDATINTAATNLTLIGRDYAGYGAFLNENFVYLLNNFARLTAPGSNNNEATPLTGQLWYNTTLNTLEVYNSTLGGWKPISSCISQGTAPNNAGSTTGDLWWDTAVNQLYVYGGSASGWVLIGPPSTSGNASISGAVVSTITDSASASHLTINFNIAGQTVAILSYDPTFTPATSITGFTTVNPGFNLAGVNDNQFVGTATQAATLSGGGGGLTSGQFLRSDINTSTSYQITATGGFVVASDLTLAVDTSNNQVSISSITNGRNFNLYANIGGVQVPSIGINASTGTVSIANAATVGAALSTAGPFTANSTSLLQGNVTLQSYLLPNSPNTIDIGSSVSRFSNVWAGTLYGNVIGNVTTTANVVAPFFVGSGAALTVLPGFAYSNVNVAAYTSAQSYTNYSNVNVTAYLAGNITVGNITTPGGNLYIDPAGNADVILPLGTSLYLQDTTNSTNATTGALIVTGGVGVGGNVYASGNLYVGGNVRVNGNVIVANVYTPLSTSGGNTSVGSTGQITYDTNYIYVCVAPNVWKRATLNLW